MEMATTLSSRTNFSVKTEIFPIRAASLCSKLNIPVKILGILFRRAEIKFSANSQISSEQFEKIASQVIDYKFSRRLFNSERVNRDQLRTPTNKIDNLEKKGRKNYDTPLSKIKIRISYSALDLKSNAFKTPRTRILYTPM